MSFDAERLYRLLPAYVRVRDHAGGLPLRALIELIAEQVAVIEEDLEQLYDDQFIETCRPWVVPYIGALVGARGLADFGDGRAIARAQVTNTIAYRRRKGTAAVLEQLAKDVTRWDANVVEYFERLATTQYMNHVRPWNEAFVDVRDALALERVGTPFDPTARTAAVRRIEPRRGTHNIPNVGLHLWRLAGLPSTGAPAHRVGPRRFTFDPLGRDVPLFGRPLREPGITHLAGPENVPMPLSRRALHHGLELHYGRDGRSGDVRSLLVVVDGTEVGTGRSSPPAATPADAVVVCDLSDVTDGAGNIIGWAHRPADKIGIDPVLGRIATAENAPPPADVRATYRYGLGAVIGGGEYDRLRSFNADGPPPVVVRVPRDAGTIQAALDQVAASGGAVEVDSNDYFVEALTVRAPARAAVELRAVDGRRPVLVPGGEWRVIGGADARVAINGLLVAGGLLRVPAADDDGQPNGLGRLALRHCTLAPGPVPAILTAPVQPAGPRLRVEVPDVVVRIGASILGPIEGNALTRFEVEDSVIDALSDTAVALRGLGPTEPGGRLHAADATIIGAVHATVIELATNTIFFATGAATSPPSAPVTAARLQEGCVRFCYVPPGSLVPRRYRCQPATEADDARVRPVFTSLRLGHPGYCQLSGHSAVEIREGADDRSEMGVFHDLHQPQRIATLRAILPDYLRFGLEGGVFLAS